MTSDDKFYFPTVGAEPDVTCTRKCMARNDGTMIGSANCLECENNLENDFDGYDWSWVKCNKIEQALKNIHETDYEKCPVLGITKMGTKSGNCKGHSGTDQAKILQADERHVLGA